MTVRIGTYMAIFISVGAIGSPSISRAALSDIDRETAAIALPFLRQSYIDGDSGGAYRKFAKPNFIQHNPDMADGLPAREEFFARREREHPGAYPSPATWANVVDRIIVDGDLFAVHHHVFMSERDPGRIFVDIWRVAQGRIVEHWDVIQTAPTMFSNTNTMWCSKGSNYAAARLMGDTVATPSCGPPGTTSDRSNSLRVVNAYIKQMTGGDVTGAIKRWFAADFKQHSPDIGDGIQGTLDHLNGEFGRGVPAKPQDLVAHLISQGDLVLVHHLLKHPGDERGKVQVDIFRVSDGKISEHWDVKQPVPANSANDHTMW